MSQTAPAIAHGLETPYPLRPCQNYFRLEGWALVLAADGPTLPRIRVGQQTFLPQSRPHREDVAATYPHEPYAATSGFLFVCYLPFGNHLGTLEVSADNGEHWHVVRSMMIPVSSHPLLGAFEPAGQQGEICVAQRLEGWVWHPEFDIAQVVMLFGDIEVPVDFGLERPDVIERFPDQIAARYSGFITRENLPRGSGRIRLQVTTTCGRVYFLESGLRASLKEGAYAPPRPVPEMWDLPFAERERSSLTGEGILPGPNNVLFVLYGDFTSNSAAHVTALANQLIARGYDCIVAVPEHAETIGAQADARFLAIEYDELARLPGYYRDGQGPAVVYAWTTREIVRQFCAQIQARHDCDLIIHLEDNEQELLATHLQCSLTELRSMTPQELDESVPPTLSHPLRAASFLRKSQGVTTIVDSLHAFIPAELPRLTFWPAATSAFQARPRNDKLRARLGFGPSDVLIFYHGNVHASNAAEVRELYEAVAQLNQRGLSTWLLRTGRDAEAFSTSIPRETLRHILPLGFIKRARDLPELMSCADYFVQPGAPGAFNDFRFPSKLPEFFALGRPVILPRTNLATELTDQADAYLLADANAASIADAIQVLQRDPALRDRLSAGALRFAANRFSWSNSAERVEEFLATHTRLQRPSEDRRRSATNVTAALAIPNTP